MTTFDIVLLIVGAALLILGGVSGVALFGRAIKISDKFGDETNVGTLWGLFFLGLAAGLLMIGIALP